MTEQSEKPQDIHSFERDGPDITIKRAEPNDGVGVHDVQIRTWLDTYPNNELNISREDIRIRVEGKNGERVANKGERWRLTIEDPESNVFVAKDGDTVVGFVAPHYDAENHQHRIGGLYVLPEYQGLGIGKQLIQKSIETHGRNHDIYLHVVPYNLKTIGFYKKLGFVETGKDVTGSSRGLDDGRYLPEIEMVLPAEQ